MAVAVYLHQKNRMNRREKVRCRANPSSEYLKGDYRWMNPVLKPAKLDPRQKNLREFRKPPPQIYFFQMHSKPSL